jgi:hypothetical protein
LSFDNLLKDLTSEKMIISNSLSFGLAKLKKKAHTSTIHTPLFRASFYFGIYLLSFYFDSLLKVVCHILSFDNLLKDLTSEKNDHLQ